MRYFYFLNLFSLFFFPLIFPYFPIFIFFIYFLPKAQRRAELLKLLKEMMVPERSTALPADIFNKLLGTISDTRAMAQFLVMVTHELGFVPDTLTYNTLLRKANNAQEEVQFFHFFPHIQHVFFAFIFLRDFLLP
jgi:hypothetical protein